MSLPEKKSSYIAMNKTLCCRFWGFFLRTLWKMLNGALHVKHSILNFLASLFPASRFHGLLNLVISSSCRQKGRKRKKKGGNQCGGRICSIVLVSFAPGEAPGCAQNGKSSRKSAHSFSYDWQPESSTYWVHFPVFLKGNWNPRASRLTHVFTRRHLDELGRLS